MPFLKRGNRPRMITCINVRMREKLWKFRRPPGDIVEVSRSASRRRPDGGIIWHPPIFFDMVSARGYWMLIIIPRMESVVERQTYATSLEGRYGKLRKRIFTPTCGGRRRRNMQNYTRLVPS